MTAFIAFARKEFVESVRTYKLLIVIAVFLLFGMLNPVTAKVMPDLLANFMPEGMTIVMPDPGAMDAWVQFYKNMTGIQIILFVILYSGIVSGELSRGTLINMLTKGLPRTTVILSKLAAVTLIWTVAYVLCFIVTHAYTLYFLPGDLPHLVFAAFCMWLFGMLILSVMLFGSVCFANIYGPLLVTGGFAVLLTVLGFVPKLEKVNPYMLASQNMSLLSGERTPADFTPAICMAILLAALFTGLAVILFKRKQI